MTSAITAHDYPSQFVDEQQHGPFRRWRHEHLFMTIADGTTKMIDAVEFGSPLGLLGSAADHLVLGRYLAHLLRQPRYAELGLGGAGADELIDAMARYPELIERPVVIWRDRAVIARPPELLLPLLEAGQNPASP